MNWIMDRALGAVASISRVTRWTSGDSRGPRHGTSSPVAVGLVALAVLAFVGTERAVWARSDAESLLARSIGYHDPDGRLLTRPHRLSFEETRPDGPSRQTEVLIDVTGERFVMTRTSTDDAGQRHVVVGRLDGDGCEMTLDGRRDVTEAEREAHRLDCDRLPRIRDYYTYLWALPMKLRDPGTRLGAVTETEFDGRPVYGLRVTYDEGVGGDVWYCYFDRKTAALVGYRFYHDEAKNDGEYILLEGEAEAVGLRIPKRRTWYTHGDERLLGTDTLVGIEATPSP